MAEDPLKTVESKLSRTQSRTFETDDGTPQPIEFFFASDPSAIVEHTKQVLYLEDDDIASISEGGKNILYFKHSYFRTSHPQTQTR